MYQSPLIISDNLQLVKKFFQVVNDSLPDISFDLGISPFSNLDVFPKCTKVLNLEDSKDVKYVLEQYDIVFSLHCKQLFPPKLVSGTTCINIHPGYNPINRGWYPQVFAILNDLDIGATIHEITNELDNGPIIAREKIEKYPWDTSLSLYNRVVNNEIKLISKHIEKIMKDKYETIMQKESSNLFLRKDFEKLKKIDLEEKVTFKEAIDKLRALSHGDYRNAHFIDRNTGKKVFLRLEIEVEDEFKN